MITYVQGDLFESPAHVLVNTVNTEGVMGKGIALTFKRIYPEMYREYRALCEAGKLDIGKLFLYPAGHKLILNFPTKKTWRRPSKPEFIEAGLKTFVANYERMRIRSIAFPPLGCGNGELDFERDVRGIMERYLSTLPIPVFIYAPRPHRGLPEHKDVAEIGSWLRSSPTDLPFGEVWDDIAGLLKERVVLRTLTRGTPYEAQHSPDEDGIRIWPAGRTELIKRDEFIILWSALRDYGFLTSQALVDRERIASYAFPVLERLDYIAVVNTGDSYDKYYYNPIVTLQLVPPARSGAEQHEFQLTDG